MTPATWNPIAALTTPLRWRKPRMVTVARDLFDPALPDEEIDRAFAVMALCPQHTFLVSTKWSARMREHISKGDMRDRVQSQCHEIGIEITGRRMALQKAEEAEEFVALSTAQWSLPNVILSITCSDQPEADARVPDLLATPAAVRWVHAVLRGLIDFTQWLHDSNCVEFMAAHWNHECICCDPREVSLDGITVSGERGPDACPLHPDWVRAVRDACAAAGVAFRFEGWGKFGLEGLSAERWLIRPDGSCDPDPLPNGIGRHPKEGFFFMYRVGKARSGRLLDGRTHDDMPEVRV